MPARTSGGRLPWVSIAAAALHVTLASPASAQDPLLEETVNVTGAILYDRIGVPALIGAVRNGETELAGFGWVSHEVGRPPDGDTLMRVGCFKKVVTHTILANSVAEERSR